MPITKEIFDAVQAANPGVDIEILQHDRLPDEVIARVPSSGTWTIYRNLQNDGKKVEAVQALVFGCVLITDTGTQADVGATLSASQKLALSRSIDSHPGIAEVWCGELVEMAGISGGARRKKF